MASTMLRVRSAFNNLVKGEHYNRFSLQPGQDGVQHVEVKLSEDALDDTAEANGQPTDGSLSYQPHPPADTRRNVCYLVLSILLIFLFGYLVGFVSHHKVPQPIICPTAPAEQPPIRQSDNHQDVVSIGQSDNHPNPASLHWGDITRLLSEKLSTQALTQALSGLDQVPRAAGSHEDAQLADNIFQLFMQQQMEPWTDKHYVQLPTQNSTMPNRVVFGSGESSVSMEPKGYLAYSPTGHPQGKVVYGNYGAPEDLAELGNRSVVLNGSVLLLRASVQISFAQQVANAAGVGASAVLVYPDPQDHSYYNDTELYGHVHLGSGDPYTPGFPSFNHTQFPPTRSSGLPSIPAQTITAKMAATILRGIGGPEANSSFIGKLSGVTYRLGGSVNATVEVNNIQASRELHNVFGVIKGSIDPDRYVVIGAQRDSWGLGYARSTVGTAILMELARAVVQMVKKDGFEPRRSIVFASWSAGEYGNVGATEWLEGYLSSLDQKAFTYISLDGVVMGKGSFIASASPLLHNLISRTMMQVQSLTESDTMFNTVKEKWLRPMALEDPAYPFLAFSGIPSLSFHIVTKGVEAYRYYGTVLDNKDHLGYATGQKTTETAVTAAMLAGLMALRLVHDSILPLNVVDYDNDIVQNVKLITDRITKLRQSGELSDVSITWLTQARGSFREAADVLRIDVGNTDLQNHPACRTLNDRIMAVERCFLSPYAAPQVTPYRHLLVGRGAHTLASLRKTVDMAEFRVQLALATWTLQSCADGMAAQIWEVDNQI